MIVTCIFHDFFSPFLFLSLSFLSVAAVEPVGHSLPADKETEKKTNRTPEEIIREDGEEAFRKIETEVLSSLAKRSGIVLAAGGGAVTREENRAILRSNGRVVWIRRDISLLPREGRPLSAGSRSVI